MNRGSLAILIGTFFAAAAAAQAQTSAGTSAQASGQASVEANKDGAHASAGASAASNPSAKTNGGNASLASGTALNAELNSSVDSKKAKVGDQVVAHTTEAVKSEGKTIVPKGTKIVGHVTRASARAKGDTESAIAIQFDKAILKNGEEMPLNVAIRAMAAEPGNPAAGSGPALDPMADAGAAAAGGSPMSGGNPGAPGAVTRAATGTVANTATGVGRTASGATNAAGGVAGSTNGAVGGLNSAGQLTANSRGVFGLNGVNLVTDASSATQGSVITSTGKNVHLDSGTRLLLVSQAEAPATPNK